MDYVHNYCIYTIIICRRWYPLTTKLYQALDTEEKTEEVTTTTPPKVKYGAGPPELTNSSNDEPEGLPWWWEYIWELPIMQVSLGCCTV